MNQMNQLPKVWADELWFCEARLDPRVSSESLIQTKNESIESLAHRLIGLIRKWFIEAWIQSYRSLSLFWTASELWAAEAVAPSSLTHNRLGIETKALWLKQIVDEHMLYWDACRPVHSPFESHRWIRTQSGRTSWSCYWVIVKPSWSDASVRPVRSSHTDSFYHSF